MNKQELEKLAEALYADVRSFFDDTFELIDQIDEPQKVVVPQTVADWIEIHKKSFSDTSAIDMYDNLTLDNSNGYYHDVWLWVIANHYDFIKAWHDGYEIEQEKVYTVEIPNPNRSGKGHAKFRLEKIGNKVVLVKRKSNECYQNKPNQKLTESEIKQDFEWAWQWAKPVEGD